MVAEGGVFVVEVVQSTKRLPDRPGLYSQEVMLLSWMRRGRECVKAKTALALWLEQPEEWTSGVGRAEGLAALELMNQGSSLGMLCPMPCGLTMVIAK